VLQRALHARSREDYLLLLEHPPVFTMGARARREHLLLPPERMGAEVVDVDRGGDVTFHGPGQLVGYPIVNAPLRRGVVADFVRSIEQVVIDACTRLGVAGLVRREGFPGVWFNPSPSQWRKVCAVGVRMTKGRTMHGFAINVTTDLSWFSRIVPCGISDCQVTSLAAEGYDIEVLELADAVVDAACAIWGHGAIDYQKASAGKLDAASPAIPIGARKPPWLRAPARMGAEFLAVKATMRDLNLVTVCEEAGCPNIFECWKDGTATFMINGDRCTRACGFCLVDTRRPLPIDPSEPERVASAVTKMGLDHAVVTAVARDDLPDGGAAAFARTVEAIRRQVPGCAVEVLIPDCRGKKAALETVFDAAPDVVNHNLETVLRLQRRVRPSAGYARSLAVLAQAAARNLRTKSGIMVGLGESFEEAVGALADLRGVGVEIVTIGQYLRPSAAHLPVYRYWSPEEIDALAAAACSLGFPSIVAAPLARSSYHARRAAAAIAPTTGSAMPHGRSCGELAGAVASVPVARRP
jgi:lipoic acid synthetase